MASAEQRWVAIDWLRGFVMILMAIDHASATFNAGRLAVDSMYPVAAFFVQGWEPGTVLDGAQFFTRWITHLCAPTFLFLSGTSLAISVAGRTARGASPGAIDRHLVARGRRPDRTSKRFWLSLGPSGQAGRYFLVLQVLFAIGASLIAMAALRRLPSRRARRRGARSGSLASDALTGWLAPLGRTDGARSPRSWSPPVSPRASVASDTRYCHGSR